MPSPRLPIATGLAVTLTAVSACGPSLEGTWSGYDSSGEAISLTFGTDNSLTIVTANADTAVPPEGDTLKYDVFDELKTTQQATGFIPIGEPDYEWPTDFTGDCYGLDRR